MVGAHAAGTDAAERQVGDGEVEQRVVDRHAAGDRLVQDPLHHRVVVAEGIQRQRAFVAVDVADRLVQCVVALHRQQRAEDFVLHDLRVITRLQQHGRRQQPLRRVGAAGQGDDVDTALPHVVEIALQARVLALVDDAGVVIAVAEVMAVARLDLAAQRFDEGIALAGRDQHVVGRDAGLAAVEPLAGGDAGGGLLDGIVVADQGRRLAAQFQRQRGEVGRGGGHHLAAHRGGTGEHQMVERQRREGGTKIGAAGGDGDAVGREDFRQQLAQEGAGAWRVLGRLQVDMVAGGDGRGQRDQRQVHRVVPRCDHADHAKRHRAHLRARRQEAPAHADPARLHPAAQVLEQVVDLVERGHAVGDPALVQRAVPEIGGDGARHLVQPALQRRAQALQVVAALGVVRLVGLPGRAQAVQGGLQVVERGIGAVHTGQCSPAGARIQP